MMYFGNLVFVNDDDNGRNATAAATAATAAAATTTSVTLETLTIINFRSYSFLSTFIYLFFFLTIEIITIGFFR